MSKTMEYYDNNAYSFAAGTLDVEFAEIQNKFLSYIPENGSILDFGCGSGRCIRHENTDSVYDNRGLLIFG